MCDRFAIYLTEADRLVCEESVSCSSQEGRRIVFWKNTGSSIYCSFCSARAAASGEPRRRERHRRDQPINQHSGIADIDMV
jgi:hypothetical protein